jgi:hypothetical protein
MDPHSAATNAPDPDAVEFVRFCYRRRRVGWPELYDEMCAVGGRGLFRGYGPDDLAAIGIGFSLFDMPALAGLACRIVAEEQALRRPVRVTIHDEDATAASPVGDGAPGAVVAAHPRRDATPDHGERTVDVPIRLTMAPSGA